MKKINLSLINENSLPRRGKYIDWKNTKGKTLLYVDSSNSIFKIDILEVESSFSCVIIYNGKEYKIKPQSLRRGELYNVIREKSLLVDRVRDTNFEIDINKTIENFSYTIEQIESFTHGSEKLLYFKCRHCGVTENKPRTPYSLFKRSKNIECNICGSTTSYPERVMGAVLEVKGVVGYKTRFPWSQGKEYDFYIPSLNTIIELHGSQHYSKRGFGAFRDEKANDKFKRELAIANGVVKYIEIDCSSRYTDQVVSSITKGVECIIPITNKEIISVYKVLERNLTMKIIEEWNKLPYGDRVPKDLVGKCGTYSEWIISNKIRVGEKLGLCSYTKQEKKIMVGKRISRAKRKILDAERLNKDTPCKMEMR